MRSKTRNTIITFGFAVVLPLLSCTDLVSPTNGVRLRAETKLANIVVADSFSVTLDATPNGSVPMHTYTDPVYAEVWATGSITLHSNPAEPGYFGPINTTNGPVYAGGSFISGGGCGLYVRVYYPGYYGVDVQGSPCNDSSANWRGIGLFQGAGTATRGGAISETGRTCHPITEPCHSQEGSQQVWIRPLPTALVFTADSRFITRGASVRFDVSANPNLMASGGGRPRRVTAWRWRRTDPSYTGSDTTIISSYCPPAGQSCTVPIYENGTMTVDAIVNGVAQTRSIVVVVNVPCPTGDTLLDDPSVRSGLAAAWAESHSDGPIADRLERGVHWFDSAGVKIYRLTPIDPLIDTPCQNANAWIPSRPPDSIISGHIHPFAVDSIVPPSCNPPGAPPNAVYKAVHPYGGPSDADWHRAWLDKLPSVIADRDSLYRIYPYPMDSVLKNGAWSYFPKTGWQANYLPVPRVIGTCVRM